jgi:hypothetical protein
VKPFTPKAEYAQNLERPAIPIAHATLTRVSEESDFRSRCPTCVGGVLLVRRDPETMRLAREDRCICCGQLFVYTDRAIAGEALEPREAR